ncbi:hypothetical protein C0991_010763, partial [Blastosporella zonata]
VAPPTAPRLQREAEANRAALPLVHTLGPSQVSSIPSGSRFYTSFRHAQEAHTRNRYHPPIPRQEFPHRSQAPCSQPPPSAPRAPRAQREAQAAGQETLMAKRDLTLHDVPMRGMLLDSAQTEGRLSLEEAPSRTSTPKRPRIF